MIQLARSAEVRKAEAEERKRRSRSTTRRSAARLDKAHGFFFLRFHVSNGKRDSKRERPRRQTPLRGAEQEAESRAEAFICCFRLPLVSLMPFRTALLTATKISGCGQRRVASTLDTKAERRRLRSNSTDQTMSQHSQCRPRSPRKMQPPEQQHQQRHLCLLLSRRRRR